MISDGFVISLFAVGLLLAFLVVIVVTTHGKETHTPYDMLTDSAALRRFSVAIVLPILIIFAVCLYPYEREHHWYETYTETVVAKDASTFNVNQDNKFRIELSNGIVFRSDDYRFVTVQVGDVIQVNCIRNWHYTSADDYDCRFGSVVTQDDAS